MPFFLIILYIPILSAKACLSEHMSCYFLGMISPFEKLRNCWNWHDDGIKIAEIYILSHTPLHTSTNNPCNFPYQQLFQQILRKFQHVEFLKACTWAMESNGDNLKHSHKYSFTHTHIVFTHFDHTLGNCGIFKQF